MNCCVLRPLNVVVGVTLLVCASGSYAITGKEIMERNYAQLLSKDTRYEFRMSIFDKTGYERKRLLTRLTRRSDPESEDSLIRFHEPSDVKGMGLLSIENQTSEDDVWLYLPALRKTRRISGRNNQDYFVGTDFTFKDLRNEQLEENKYSLLREEKYGGEDCYVVEAIPVTAREKEESGYGRRELWITKRHWLIVHAKFFDDHGDLMKVFNASDIRLVKASEDKWRPFLLEMENFRRPQKTRLWFEEITVDAGVSEKVFSRRYLRKEW